MKKAHNKNGTVKIMNRLPEKWTKENGQDIINFRSATEAELEALEIFDVQLDPITEIQRYKNSLVPGDFDAVNKVWIMPIVDFTQEEIDRHEEQQLDQDESATKFQNRISDGTQQFKRFIDIVIRNKDNGTINGQEALATITLFDPALQHLKDGLHELSKQKVNQLNPVEPFDVNLKTKIKNFLTNYINENPL